MRACVRHLPPISTHGPDTLKACVLDTHIIHTNIEIYGSVHIEYGICTVYTHYTHYMSLNAKPGVKVKNVTNPDLGPPEIKSNRRESPCTALNRRSDIAA